MAGMVFVSAQKLPGIVWTVYYKEQFERENM